MLFFLGFLKRPKEAHKKAIEKKNLEGGVVMDGWKQLLINLMQMGHSNER